MKCDDFFHANTSCHAMTLTSDPLILKVCGRSGGTWSWSVLNLIEIAQSSADLFTIWQFFAHVTSRCDLDLWALDLELLWYFGRRVSKACVKFERNRTIRGRVIHDLAHFRRQIFDQGPNPRIDLRGAWTELHQTCRGHRGIIAELQDCFRLQISCCIFKRGPLKVELCWKRCQISHFLTLCKN